MQYQTKWLKVSLIASTMAVFSFSAYATAPGLTLGGKFVPKESIKVLICVGNSAMSGRDPLPDTIKDSHLWKYEISPAKFDWLPAAEPLSVDAYNTLATPKGGPVMPLLKKLASFYPGCYFGVMQKSSSGFTLIGNFDKGSSGYTTIIGEANKLKANVTIAGIISMLNIVEEQNGAGNSGITNYANDVRDMVNNMRTDLGLGQIPYVHAMYPVMAGGGYAITTTAAQQIIAQIAKIPGLIQNCALIPTDSLTICSNCQPLGYLSHYDHNGNVGWGNRTADTIKARNWIAPVQIKSGIQQTSLLVNSTATLHKVFFNGTDYSVFGKLGNSFSVYMPNGRIITEANRSLLEQRNLIPGIYIIRKKLK